MLESLLLTLVLAVPAQDIFKPGDALDGYSAARLSQYSRLYDFKVYEAFRGLDVSFTQRALLSQQWKEEKARVTLLIGEIASSPTAKAGFRMEERIAKHRHLKTVVFERVDQYPPFVFFVQKPPKAEAGFVVSNLAPYCRWLQQLETLFRTEFAGPLRLKTREAPHTYGVFILASAGDYLNFLDAKTVSSDGYGHYDQGLDMVIAYRNPRSNQPARTKRLPAMGDTVFAMLSAYGLDGPPPPDLFFTNGLAGYLSYHQLDNREDLARHRPNPQFVDAILKTLDDPKLVGWRLSLENLLATTRKSGNLKGLAQRIGVGVTRDDLRYLRWQFEAHSAMWVHFLRHAERGRFKDQAGLYLTKVMSGEDGAETFKETFGASDLAQLDVEFASYVRRLSDKRAIPAVPTIAAEENSVSPTGFDMRRIAIEAADTKTLIGAALALARDGRVQEALASLELAATEGDDDAARVRRAITRLTATRAARAAYVAELTEKGGKLRLTIEGKRVNLRVEGVVDGALKFARNKSGIDRIPINEISLGELFKSLGKRTGEFGPTWVRAYAAVLSGDNRWANHARGDSPEEQELLADAPGIPDLLVLGAALRRLNAIAQRAAPVDSRLAAHAYTELSDLMKEHGQSPPVAARREVLREYAKLLLAQLFVTEGLQQLLHVPVTHLGDGRVRVAYEFDSVDELQDFTEDPDYLAGLREHYAEGTPRPKDTSTRVAGGELALEGWTALRTKLAFEAPITVRYQYNVSSIEAVGNSVVSMRVGICDDGAGNYIACADTGALVVIDGPSRIDTVRVDPTMPSHPLEPLAMELRHYGESSVETWSAGKKKFDSPFGARRSGRAFLWSHSTAPVYFQRFEIEGTVALGDSKELIDEWAQSRLAELGLQE